MDRIEMEGFLEILDIVLGIWFGVGFSSKKMVYLRLKMVLDPSLAWDGCRDLADEFPCSEWTHYLKRILDVSNVVFLEQVDWQE